MTIPVWIGPVVEDDVRIEDAVRANAGVAAYVVAADQRNFAVTCVRSAMTEWGPM